MSEATEPIDYSHVTRISPEDLAALAALNEKVNIVCWSHDDHRPGEIRDEDDEVVGYFESYRHNDAAAFIVSAKNNMDGLLALVADLTHERDEAREWVRNLTSSERALTCVYCGHAYPPGTPAHGSPVLTVHIEQCEKHPVKALRDKLDAFRMLLRTAAHMAEGVGSADQAKTYRDVNRELGEIFFGETPDQADA
jgi:hypothetical protein